MVTQTSIEVTGSAVQASSEGEPLPARVGVAAWQFCVAIVGRLVRRKPHVAGWRDRLRRLTNEELISSFLRLLVKWQEYAATHLRWTDPPFRMPGLIKLRYQICDIPVGVWKLSTRNVCVGDATAAMMYACGFGLPAVESMGFGAVVLRYMDMFKIKRPLRFYSKQERYDKTQLQQSLQEGVQSIIGTGKLFQFEMRVLAKEMGKKRYEMQRMDAPNPKEDLQIETLLNDSYLLARANLASRRVFSFRQLGRLYAGLQGVVADIKERIGEVRKLQAEWEEERLANATQPQALAELLRAEGPDGELVYGNALEGFRITEDGMVVADWEDDTEEVQPVVPMPRASVLERALAAQGDENNEDSGLYDGEEALLDDRVVLLDTNDAAHTELVEELQHRREELKAIAAKDRQPNRYQQLVDLMEQGNQRLKQALTTTRTQAIVIEGYRDNISEMLMEDAKRHVIESAKNGTLPRVWLQRVNTEVFPTKGLKKLAFLQNKREQLRLELENRGKETDEEKNLRRQLNNILQNPDFFRTGRGSLTAALPVRRPSLPATVAAEPSGAGGTRTGAYVAGPSPRALLEPPSPAGGDGTDATRRPGRVRKSARNLALPANIRVLANNAGQAADPEEVRQEWPPGTSEEGDRIIALLEKYKATAYAVARGVQFLESMEDLSALSKEVRRFVIICADLDHYLDLFVYGLDLAPLPAAIVEDALHATPLAMMEDIDLLLPKMGKTASGRRPSIRMVPPKDPVKQRLLDVKAKLEKESSKLRDKNIMLQAQVEELRVLVRQTEEEGIRARMVLEQMRRQKSVVDEDALVDPAEAAAKEKEYQFRELRRELARARQRKAELKEAVGKLELQMKAEKKKTGKRVAEPVVVRQRRASQGHILVAATAAEEVVHKTEVLGLSVPLRAVPGVTLEVMAPSGATILVVVPEGAAPGCPLQVHVPGSPKLAGEFHGEHHRHGDRPAEQVHWEPQLLTVAAPAGAVPGAFLQLVLPSGAVLRVEVPPGTVEGKLLEFGLPEEFHSVAARAARHRWHLARELEKLYAYEPWRKAFPKDPPRLAKKKWDFCVARNISVETLSHKKQLLRLRMRLVRICRQRKREMKLKLRVLMNFLSPEERKKVLKGLTDGTRDNKTEAQFRKDYKELAERSAMLGKLLEHWSRRCEAIQEEVRGKQQIVRDLLVAVLGTVRDMARELRLRDPRVAPSKRVPLQRAWREPARFHRREARLPEKAREPTAAELQASLEASLGKVSNSGRQRKTRRRLNDTEKRGILALHDTLTTLQKNDRPLQLPECTLSDTLLNEDGTGADLFVSSMMRLRELDAPARAVAVKHLSNLEHSRLLALMRRQSVDAATMDAIEACQVAIEALKQQPDSVERLAALAKELGGDRSSASDDENTSSSGSGSRPGSAADRLQLQRERRKSGGVLTRRRSMVSTLSGRRRSRPSLSLPGGRRPSFLDAPPPMQRTPSIAKKLRRASAILSASMVAELAAIADAKGERDDGEASDDDDDDDWYARGGAVGAWRRLQERGAHDIIAALAAVGITGPPGAERKPKSFVNLAMSLTTRLRHTMKRSMTQTYQMSLEEAMQERKSKTLAAKFEKVLRKRGGFVESRRLERSMSLLGPEEGALPWRQKKFRHAQRAAAEAKEAWQRRPSQPEAWSEEHGRNWASVKEAVRASKDHHHSMQQQRVADMLAEMGQGNKEGATKVEGGSSVRTLTEAQRSADKEKAAASAATGRERRVSMFEALRAEVRQKIVTDMRLDMTRRLRNEARRGSLVISPTQDSSRRTPKTLKGDRRSSAELSSPNSTRIRGFQLDQFLFGPTDEDQEAELQDRAAAQDSPQSPRSPESPGSPRRSSNPWRRSVGTRRSQSAEPLLGLSRRLSRRFGSAARGVVAELVGSAAAARGAVAELASASLFAAPAMAVAESSPGGAAVEAAAAVASAAAPPRPPGPPSPPPPGPRKQRRLIPNTIFWSFVPKGLGRGPEEGEGGLAAAASLLRTGGSSVPAEGGQDGSPALRRAVRALRVWSRWAQPPAGPGADEAAQRGGHGAELADLLQGSKASISESRPTGGRPLTNRGGGGAVHRGTARAAMWAAAAFGSGAGKQRGPLEPSAPGLHLESRRLRGPPTRPRRRLKEDSDAAMEADAEDIFEDDGALSSSSGGSLANIWHAGAEGGGRGGRRLKGPAPPVARGTAARKPQQTVQPLGVLQGQEVTGKRLNLAGASGDAGTRGAGGPAPPRVAGTKGAISRPAPNPEVPDLEVVGTHISTKDSRGALRWGYFSPSGASTPSLPDRPIQLDETLQGIVDALKEVARQEMGRPAGASASPGRGITGVATGSAGGRSKADVGLLTGQRAFLGQALEADQDIDDCLNEADFAPGASRLSLSSAGSVAALLADVTSAHEREASRQPAARRAPPADQAQAVPDLDFAPRGRRPLLLEQLPVLRAAAEAAQREVDSKANATEGIGHAAYLTMPGSPGAAPLPRPTSSSSALFAAARPATGPAGTGRRAGGPPEEASAAVAAAGRPESSIAIVGTAKFTKAPAAASIVRSLVAPAAGPRGGALARSATGSALGGARLAALSSDPGHRGSKMRKLDSYLASFQRNDLEALLRDEGSRPGTRLSRPVTRQSTSRSGSRPGTRQSASPSPSPSPGRPPEGRSPSPQRPPPQQQAQQQLRLQQPQEQQGQPGPLPQHQHQHQQQLQQQQTQQAPPQQAPQPAPAHIQVSVWPDFEWPHSLAPTPQPAEKVPVGSTTPAEKEKERVDSSHSNSTALPSLYGGGNRSSSSPFGHSSTSDSWRRALTSRESGHWMTRAAQTLTPRGGGASSVPTGSHFSVTAATPPVLAEPVGSKRAATALPGLRTRKCSDGVAVARAASAAGGPKPEELRRPDTVGGFPMASPRPEVQAAAAAAATSPAPPPGTAGAKPQGPFAGDPRWWMAELEAGDRKAQPLVRSKRQPGCAVAPKAHGDRWARSSDRVAAPPRRGQG